MNVWIQPIVVWKVATSCKVFEKMVLCKLKLFACTLLDVLCYANCVHLKGEVRFLPTCITTLTRCCENTCALKIADI